MLFMTDMFLKGRIINNKINVIVELKIINSLTIDLDDFDIFRWVVVVSKHNFEETAYIRK